MTSFDDKIATTVERTRAIWGLLTLLGGVFVFLNYDWWAWGAYVVFSFFTYYATLYAVSLACALLWDGNEIQNGLREKGRSALSAKLGSEVTDEERQKLLDDAGIVEAELVGTANPPFGRFMDQDMFDWIDLKTNNNNNTTRFVYEHVAQRDVAGNVIIPDEEGFAHLNGIIYKRAQPAQTVA